MLTFFFLFLDLGKFAAVVLKAGEIWCSLVCPTIQYHRKCYAPKHTYTNIIVIFVEIVAASMNLNNNDQWTKTKTIAPCIWCECFQLHCIVARFASRTKCNYSKLKTTYIWSYWILIETCSGHQLHLFWSLAMSSHPEKWIELSYRNESIISVYLKSTTHSNLYLTAVISFAIYLCLCHCIYVRRRNNVRNFISSLRISSVLHLIIISSAWTINMSNEQWTCLFHICSISFTILFAGATYGRNFRMRKIVAELYRVCLHTLGYLHMYISTI